MSKAIDARVVDMAKTLMKKATVVSSHITYKGPESSSICIAAGEMMRVIDLLKAELEELNVSTSRKRGRRRKS